MIPDLRARYYRRVRRLLTLVLTIAWLATAACANAERIPEIHRHMPCCPAQAGTPGCSTAQCGQVLERTEIRSGARVANLPVAEGVSSHWSVPRSAESLRELTPGLRFRAAVFRLKDDLRI